MANLVIVTKHCYLLCESINSISLEECDGQDEKWAPLPKKKKKMALKPNKAIKTDAIKNTLEYEITIDFISSMAPTSGRNGGSDRTLAIRIRGYDRALALYKDMVNQIREQLPDKLFLDKLCDKFFSENPDPINQ